MKFLIFLCATTGSVLFQKIQPVTGQIVIGTYTRYPGTVDPYPTYESSSTEEELTSSSQTPYTTVTTYSTKKSSSVPSSSSKPYSSSSSTPKPSSSSTGPSYSYPPTTSTVKTMKPVTSAYPTTSSTTVKSSSSISTSSSPCLSIKYGPCGGEGYTGCTICPSGWKCKWQNEFYSQCVDASVTEVSSSTVATYSSTTQKTTSKAISSTTTPYSSSVTQKTTSKPVTSGYPTTTSTTVKSSSSSSASSSPCLSINYGPCGGEGYTGCTVCPSGWVCKWQNEFYSQCVAAE